MSQFLALNIAIATVHYGHGIRKREMAYFKDLIAWGRAEAAAGRPPWKDLDILATNQSLRRRHTALQPAGAALRSTRGNPIAHGTNRSGAAVSHEVNMAARDEEIRRLRQQVMALQQQVLQLQTRKGAP